MHAVNFEENKIFKKGTSMSRKKRKLNNIGRKGHRVAAAVAVCAMTGMMFSGSANAADWKLGQSIVGSQLSGTTYYNSTVKSWNNGLLIGPGAPGGSNPTTINNSVGISETNLTGSIRSTDYTGNFFSALGSVNLAPSGGLYGVADNYTLGSGATIQALTTGIAAGGTSFGGNVTGQYTPTLFYYNAGT